MSAADALFDLYLVTDPELGDVVARTRAALSAVPRGRVAVQLRAKHLAERDVLALARALRGPTRDAGVALLVNGRADLARIADADGVHLPERSISPREARVVLGERAVVGVSCHDARGLTDAVDGGATFVTLGPFDVTPDKGPAMARARFADLSAGCALPVFALGGVDETSIADALAAGAHGVALVRAVFASPDPAAATERLVAALDAARSAPR